MNQHLTGGSRNSNGMLVTGPCTVRNFGILSGGSAGTAIFYDGNDATGAILWALGTAANVSDGQSFQGLRVKNGIYVEVTNSARALVTIENPAPNQ